MAPNNNNIRLKGIAHLVTSMRLEALVPIIPINASMKVGAQHVNPVNRAGIKAKTVCFFDVSLQIFGLLRLSIKMNTFRNTNRFRIIIKLMFSGAMFIDKAIGRSSRATDSQRKGALILKLCFTQLFIRIQLKLLFFTKVI